MTDKPKSNRQDPDLPASLGRPLHLSLELPDVAGTRIRIHGSSALIIVWIAILGWEAGFDAAALARVYFLLLAAAVCLILHELGHVLMARRQGLKAREILLLPMGAFTTFEHSTDNDDESDEAPPSSPPPELGFAACAAGPSVNLLLALLAFAAAMFTGESLAANIYEVALAGWAQKLGWINFAIAAFNLIPAYPFDGGKMLYALLRGHLPEKKVRDGLAATGFVVAALFVVAGLKVDLLFLVLAALVAWGAIRERNQGEAVSLLKKLSVEDALTRNLERLSPFDDVVQALERMLASGQRALPVVEEGRLVGIVTRERLAKGAAGGRMRVQVRDVMDRDPPSTHPSEALDEAIAMMRRAGLTLLPVVEDGTFVGALRLDEAQERSLEQEAQNEAVSRTPRTLL